MANEKMKTEKWEMASAEKNRATLKNANMENLKAEEIGYPSLSEDRKYYVLSLGNEGVLYFPTEDGASEARDAIIRIFFPKYCNAADCGEFHTEKGKFCPMCQSVADEEAEVD